MKVGSLFSGIGGLDLGLERAGMEIIWQVEIDPFCQKILKKHWPEVPCYGDIKEIDFTTLPRPDLICGGFPCQPISVAGKRGGKEDKRWLWPEFYRAICEIRPKWVITENVPGLLSMDCGELLREILWDFAKVGYDTEWDVLPTGIGRGHRRYRIFILAYPNRTGFPGTWEYCKTEDHTESVIMEPTFTSFCRPQSPPELVRNIHGIPRRMDRIKALGNAVVPQVAEWIGRRIMEVLSD